MRLTHVACELATLELIVSCTRATLPNLIPAQELKRLPTAFCLRVPSLGVDQNHMRMIEQQQLPESTDATTSFTTEFRKSCCGFDLLKKRLPDQHKVEQSYLIHCCDTQFE